MSSDRWPVIRDVALFVAGIGGVAHETLLASSERPTLLILFAAMMGLPAFLKGEASDSAKATEAVVTKKGKGEKDADDDA